MTKSSHHDTSKTIVAFLVVAVAFGIFILSFAYSSSILASQQQYYTFITLTGVVMALLLGLVYLVNNSKAPKIKSAKTSTKPLKKKKK